ncbi:rhomboid-like protein [Embleya sp. AB8]|uniref:rhomboid-like protein n=1 Tax=Embleya sp. AB8 TaxID=3156304 RepID=UPI003C79048E
MGDPLLAPTVESTRRALGRIRDWIVSAPATYLWLLIIHITTLDMYVRLTAGERAEFLEEQSTNLHNLDTSPLRVMAASAVWAEGWHVIRFTLILTVLCAVAERWVGTRRMLIVAVLGHVGATCLSQAFVLTRIHEGALAESARFQVDVGPSYAYMAVAGLLFHRITPGRWRWLYAAALALYVGLPLLPDQDVTATGHLSAALLGLCCYRLARGRPTWDPGQWWRTRRPWPGGGPVEAGPPAREVSGSSPNGL